MRTTLPDFKLNTLCDYAEYLSILEGEFDFNEIPLDENDKPVVEIKDVASVLEERSKWYGDKVPFLVSRDKIERIVNEDKLDNYNHYLFCLYYALYGGSENKKASDIFELITDVALKKYVGTEDSILTSFSASSDRTMKEKIHSIIHGTKENIGNIDYMPKKSKDGGIDIVTYKSLDNRGNQIVVLTDATIGKNWMNKCLAPKLESWKEYIFFKVCPITCVSTVHIIDKDSIHNQSKGKGLLMDRTRIFKFYQIDNEINALLLNWKNEVC